MELGSELLNFTSFTCPLESSFSLSLVHGHLACAIKEPEKVRFDMTFIDQIDSRW